MKNLDFLGYPNYAVDKSGYIFSIKSRRFLKNSLSSTSGRYRVNLINESGSRTFEVHRLVALCFVHNPDPDKLTVVNHLDGNPLNNYYKNLEWTTAEGNSIHAAANYLWDARSLDVDTVHNILGMMEDGMRNKDIAEVTNVPYHIIAKIRQGENYRDIWEEYNVPIKSHTISLSKAKYIKQLLNDGLSVSDIIKKVNVRRGLIKDIRDGRKFRNLI